MKKEKRTQPWRRQFNESFCTPEGHLSWTKTMSNVGQTIACVHFADKFAVLVDKPESMAIVLMFIVAPDVLKKFLTMKYGGSQK